MHPNICSFAKGVLEEVLANDYEGVILTTCCDSIRRLYDVLREELPGKFVYILDTPRTTKETGVALYQTRIKNMIKAYEDFPGNPSAKTSWKKFFLRCQKSKAYQ